VYQEYPSSIPLVYKQCPDLFYRTCTRSAQQYQCSVQHYKNKLVVITTQSGYHGCRQVEKTVVMRGLLLVVETNCLRQPLVYKACPSLYTCCVQIGHWLGHVYISKQFPSLSTLSVTAWTQLVHIYEQVSFQVGHSNFYSIKTALGIADSTVC